MQEIIAKNKLNDISKINDSRIKIILKEQRLLPPKQGYLCLKASRKTMVSKTGH